LRVLPAPRQSENFQFSKIELLHHLARICTTIAEIRTIVTSVQYRPQQFARFASTAPE